ncbi:AIPR family protein [Microbacterium sp. CFH 90308]|uniref:AIPR family protein n=1 Tax=Microbacterium salsuginis TaxID=2722803 RepID=A0ABX1K8J3_9MICO|nr:AIPR family protein [Microbacterium sp. CFH 90308]NLP83341.1 AIPR family protein [Microbacterium sp. CFH 90308]
MDELDAAKHVTDGTNDNGIDAIYVDLRDRRIYVVQSKWHDQGTGSISVGDMHKTVSGLRDLTEEKFDRFNKKFASTIRDIETALGDPAVTFCLVVAITGETKLAKEVQDVVDDALAEMNEISEMLTVKLLGLAELHQILREGGAAPKIDLELTLEGWGSVSEPYAAFYGVIDGVTVAQWYLEHGGRLFDDNLRKALGTTAVNAQLTATIEEDPQNFWYFNNGITALCSSVKKTAKGGASRVTGDFVVNGMSIVNGAQTVSSLAEKYKADSSALDSVQVWIRLISLEGCPPEFATDVTRATNTQNVVESRDFLSLDPNQQRLQDDIQLSLGKRYVFKRGEPAPEFVDGCTVSEALVALACAKPDSGFAVLAKSAIGRLEDRRGRYYPQLFRDSTTAFEVWQSVQVHRAVEQSLMDLRAASEGKRKAVATQGNRMIAHAVLQKLSASHDLSAEIPESLWSALLEEVPQLTEKTLDLLWAHVESDYASNYVTSLFKNAAKCNDISNHLKAVLEV